MNLLNIKAPTSPAPHAVRIELETPVGGHLAGDPLIGRVAVEPGVGAPPTEAYVELQFVALGELSTIARVSRQAIPTSGWRSNEPFTAPFSLAVPDLPLPNQGHLFRSSLRVAVVFGPDPAARAFPVASQELSVDAGSPLTVRRITRPGRKLSPGRRGSGRGLAIGTLLMTLGLVCVAMLLRSLDIWIDDSGTSIPAAAVFAGLALMLLLTGGMIVRGTYGNWRSERVLGHPVVRIVDPADTSAILSVSLAFTPLAPIREVTLTLQITESLQDPQNDVQGAWSREQSIAKLSFPLRQAEPGRWSVDLLSEELAHLPLPINLIGANRYWNLSLEAVTSSGHRWAHRAQLMAYRGSLWEPDLGAIIVFR